MSDFAKLVMGADTRGLKDALKDLTNLEKGAEKTESVTNKLNKGLMALGVAAAGTAVSMAVGVKSAINTADGYAKLSQRLGIAVKDLGALAHAADLSGVSLDSVAMGVQFLSRNMVNQPKAFAALGIAVTDATGNLRDSQQVLNDLADKFTNMPDGAQKTAIAMELVGRGGAALIPLLNGGSKAMDEMREEAEALGLVISEKTAKQAEQFNDNLSRVTSGLTGVFNIISAQVLPVLVDLTNDLVALTKDGVKFFRENLATMTTVLEHGLIIATSFATFMAGRYAISLAAAGVAAIAPTIQMLALAASISASSLAASLASVALKGLSRALLTTGIGVLIVGAGELAALLIDLRTKTGSWGEAFALVGGVVKGFFVDAVEWAKTFGLGIGSAFSGLWAAIKAGATGGDISEAFLAEFKNIEFGATNTMAAIERMNAALNSQSPGASSDNPGIPPQKPVVPGTPQPPSQEVLDKYNELTLSLTQQAEALGMTARNAAIYNAQMQLGEGATGAMVARVGELAGALFDKNASVEATKATEDSYKTTLDAVNDSIGAQLDALIKTDEQIAIDNALKKISGNLTDKELENLTERIKLDLTLTKATEKHNKMEKSALELKRDLMTNQELLNEKMVEYGELLAGGFIDQQEFDEAIERTKKSLNIDTRSIGEQMWDGLKSTFFDPFEAGADKMADKFAQQVDRMSSAAERMNNGKSTVDKLQGGLDVLSNIPGRIGAVSGAISKAISIVKSVVGLVKSIGSLLFGGSWQTTGGGMELSLGEAGINGRMFETQHKKGGLFSSSKDRTLYSAMKSEQLDQYNVAYKGILDNAAAAFGLFGIEASRDIMESVRVATLTVKTSGEGALSESAAKAAVEDWFKQLDKAIVSAVGGEAVQALLDLATPGEAATETLARLGNQLHVVNGSLDLLSQSIYNIGINGAVMANSLVEASGGMEQFQAGINSFFENFFTDQEQFDKLTERLTGTFAELNMTLPTTREAVRDIVDGLDLTTEAGQKAFAAIIGSSDAMNTYFAKLETDAQQLLTSTTTTAQRATEASLSALNQSIEKEKVIKREAYNESVALIQSEGRIRIQAANLALNAARQNMSELQSEVNSVMNAFNSAQSQFDPAGSRRGAVALLQAAMQSGDFTGAGAAAQQAAQLNVSDFTSMAAFRREQARTLNLLGEVSARGQTQINYAALTVRTLEREIEAITGSTAELINIETFLFDQEIEVLTNQLTNSENQLNVLRGIDEGIYSVEVALQNFYEAIRMERLSNRPPGITTGNTHSLIESQNVPVVAALNRIAAYGQATATATVKSFNLADREWREAQAEEVV